MAILSSGLEPAAQRSRVRLEHLPAGGIQPLAHVDGDGMLHVVYFSGDPKAGDLFYQTRPSHQQTRPSRQNGWSTPVRINSQLGSVIAIGTVRGARMALGRDGRVHVAWMGSAEAEPRGPDDQSPMLYTRSATRGRGFEPQRNVIHHAYGLDGGGTVAADRDGTVYVVWHAPDEGTHAEEHRRVWLTTSRDDGVTFAPEVAMSPAGVCGCCGMTASASAGGRMLVLYRGFEPPDHRGMYLLSRVRHAGSFARTLLEPWRIGACPMSTSAATIDADGDLLAWETDGQVAWSRMESGRLSTPIHPPGTGHHRKHPAVTRHPNGNVMLVWTEGTAWARGGTLHWQEFDADGRPTAIRGYADGVPAWSRAAVVTDGDDRYSIVF